MCHWKGEDWIKHLNEENPIITIEMVDEFENSLNDELILHSIKKPCESSLPGPYTCYRTPSKDLKSLNKSNSELDDPFMLDPVPT